MIGSEISIGMFLGLLTFFRQHANSTGLVARRLAASTYGICLGHVYFVVGLQIPLVDTTLGPLTKFLIVTVAGIALSLAFVDTVRRVPAQRRPAWYFHDFADWPRCSLPNGSTAPRK